MVGRRIGVPDGFNHECKPFMMAFDRLYQACIERFPKSTYSPGQGQQEADNGDPDEET
jgi:hypothetical protein